MNEYNDYKEYVARQEKCIQCIPCMHYTGVIGYRGRLFLFINLLKYMKKEVILTVRVDPEIKDLISSIAKEDDRTVAWVTRSLITEALQARRLLKSKPKSKTEK